MSSYVASPFEIESRRLQGIINVCNQNLNQAIHDLQNYQKSLTEKHLEQQRQDRKSIAEIRQASAVELEKSRKRKEEISQKRAELRTALKNMQIQLDVFAKHYGELKIAADRQQKLEYSLEHSESDLLLVEREIASHVRMTEMEIRKNSSDRVRAQIQQEVARKKITRGARISSLAIEEEEEKTKRSAPVLHDLFEAKLQQALSSEYALRIPDLQEMQREYEKTPSYAKSAYAARNKKRLEMALSRLDSIQQQKEQKASMNNQMALRYQGYCKLLNRKVEESLMTNPAKAKLLEKVCEEYERLYREQEKRAYVSNALAAVMKKRGIEYQDAGPGGNMLFAMDHAQLSVAGTGTDYLTMEIAGEYSGAAPTLDDRRKSQAAAVHFCSMLQDITEELRRDYGVVFKHITTEEPTADRIVMKKSGTQGSRKYHADKKTMTIG